MNFYSTSGMTRLSLIVGLVFLLRASCFSRDKRQLVFPPQSIMQLAFGVVTPAQVKNRQIATNMGIMFNIDLPTNVSIWYPWRADYRRKRSADSNQAFYNLLQNILTMYGLDGKACMQKSVCQIEETTFPRDDMFMQILNLVFGSGQSHTQGLREPKNHNKSCSLAFPTCQHSAVDIFFHLVTSTWTSSQ